MDKQGALRTTEPVNASNRNPRSNAGSNQPGNSRMVKYKGKYVAADTVAFGWNFDAAGLVFIILLPMIVWLILFAINSSLSTSIWKNGEKQTNLVKHSFWTMIITIVIYILLWIFITVIPRAVYRGRS